MDHWAAKAPTVQVTAQIGATKYKPERMTAVGSLTAAEYSALFNQADVVVAHAGMGTIISALESGKPLVIMPRLESLGEHRNNHQVGTAKHFGKHTLITVVECEQALTEALNRLLAEDPVQNEASNTGPDETLIEKIRLFLSE